uniref:Alpha-(1,6)-fucosyltransferase n=1 Tax=Strigamia maritima TaxID=126957 RepID=A0A0A1TKW5_STRMM|nr:TPA_inf: alpha1,6 fucosyltransferase [Strigamia maritima]
MAVGVGKAIVVLLAVWLIIILLMTGPILHSNENDEHITRRLTKAMNELEVLKRQNDELRAILLEFKIVDVDKSKDQLLDDLHEKLNKANELLHKAESGSTNTVCDPSAQFENVRRRIINQVNEMWLYTKNELKVLKTKMDDDKTKIKMDKMIRLETQYKRVILNDLATLSNIDGLGEWREREAKSLSDLIQRRLHYLQNPKDCKNAKKLNCNLNKGCGYGCQIHHVVYCFIVAYGSGRTLILNSKGWRYNKDGWESVFKPVSDSCTSTMGVGSAMWPGYGDAQVLDLPIIDSISPRPDYLPLAIPRDLAARMQRLHGDPIVWWVGQFLKYLLRPQPNLQANIDEMTDKLGFKKPIVGIHVRRTDKVGTEAAFHKLHEYMLHAGEFYQQLALRQNVTERRIYLASDDPNVFAEAKRSFPGFEFIGDPNIAKSAAMATRYTDSSLRGIILDVHFLSMSDYLVCTFSSQVCRIAYEIMQTVNPNAASNFRSLDDIYYFGGQNAHNHRVIYSHESQASNELELMAGDVIGIAGNHWDGYSKGINRRTKQQGLYPSFKATNKLQIADFPTYPEVKQNELSSSR